MANIYDFYINIQEYNYWQEFYSLILLLKQNENLKIPKVFFKKCFHFS